ncbi:MAG: zinc ribbon domain-containing protein [Clostridia bacterium]|nr:zinc ribbon domain-containing protein [Clostridia bacterium]
MKRIQSKAGLLKRRVNAVHSRAKFVGVIYLLATIALAAAVAVLPLMSGMIFSMQNQMPVVTFYNGVKELFDLGIGEVFKDPALIIVFLQLVLYFVLLLVVVINVLRALSKLNWLFKRKASYINGFNRNMYAMDALGKRFSSSFAAVVIFYALFALLTFRGEDLVLYSFLKFCGEITTAPAITLMGYITLGVALVIRFVFGALEGSVPLFTTGGKIVEKKRDHGLLIYFIRNLVQVVVVGGVLFFLNSASGFTYGLYEILTEIIVDGNKMYLINVNAIPVYVELIALVCLMVMIKHAAASTEYNRDCNHGDGMKNFAVFAIFAALCFGALILLPFLGIGVAEGEEAALNMPMLWAAVIAFVGFLFDCICRARDKKRKEEETDADPIPADEEPEEKPVAEANTPYGLPIQPQFQYPYMTAATADAVEENGNKQVPYQPIFVPVFCAFPQGGMMPQPPAPAPAPEHLLPAPSPAVAEAEANEETEETVEDDTLNPYRKYKVYCPQCGKALMVRDASPYHRCPACDKVFKLRKFKTYVKSV